MRAAARLFPALLALLLAALPGASRAQVGDLRSEQGQEVIHWLPAPQLGAKTVGGGFYEIAPAAPLRIDPAEFECLALNVYFEAGGESRSGQLAVAWVTLNRLADERFPKTVCDVVRQGGEQRNRCQFHWWCDGLPDVPLNPQRWADSEQAARDALSGLRPDPTGGALYFHNATVRPSWTRRLTTTARIGNHTFYR
ncbi:Cell Wall Hydrolase [Tistlia consotensis]|uniref:Cell Wall Hydrolase n=1 Tax=Tistlia consotensis USBA 355 TaxID=560819 RepID=A0A1Y6CJQ5_9PROT|nr:cell wall hydrolase [Tistlia consotensis]SMF70607.1 Cell Wall Hydrolase [Tistlia consotensis USBA 355]SNS04408.1 Cell Wall Hydrolase [Tistlia consotensis]